MTDYEKIGFKCGIELHNRLNTRTKLFCKCKPSFSFDKPSMIIKRKLRAVAGELGQVDVAALYEYLRDRTFFYQIYHDTTCLIESDCEPPRSINKEALEVALQVALLLKAEIPDEIHIMRKTVIDGSNTCAFQRTAIVGMNGVLDTTQGRVRITNISLEEESAGIVKQEDNEITYRLDRLGIPLIEIGTAPDIKSPEHAKEVAEKLGMIIRSTGKSQRGIGVTRQDVNVSITKGARVEIKGVQELDMIPQIIENEIRRQQEQIAKGEKPKEETRVAKEDGTTEFTRPLPGGERLYPETDLETIVIDKKLLSRIKIPETWEQKSKKLSKVLPKEMINQVLRSEYLELFEKLSKEYDPVLVANTLISTVKDLKRRDFKIECLTEKQFVDLFSSVKNKKISKEAIPNILEKVCPKEIKITLVDKISITDVIETSGLKALDEEQLKGIIKKIFAKYPNLVKEKKTSALMGEVMKEVRGKISGEVVSNVLNFTELEIQGLVNKELERNMKDNPKDTNLQIIIALFLLENGFNLELETLHNGKRRDIIVKNPFTVIEVTNMKDEEKFRDVKPLQVVNLGTINLQRIEERILEKVNKLKDVSPSIIIFGLPPGTEKDEFDDVFYENNDIWKSMENIDMIIGWRSKRPEFYIENPHKKPLEGSLAKWFKKIMDRNKTS